MYGQVHNLIHGNEATHLSDLNKYRFFRYTEEDILASRRDVAHEITVYPNAAVHGVPFNVKRKYLGYRVIFLNELAWIGSGRYNARIYSRIR